MADHPACAAPVPDLFFFSAFSATMASGSATTQDASAGTSQQTFSLENILTGDHENIEHPETATKEALKAAGGWDEEEGQEDVAQGFCVECEGVSYRQNVVMPNSIDRGRHQTSQHRSSVRRARTTSAKYVSQLSTGKVLANVMPVNPCQDTAKRKPR